MADSGKSTGTVDVFDEPYGVVSDEQGRRIFVTLDYPGQVVEIDARQRKIVRRLGVGKFVRGLAFSQKENRLYATEFYTSKVLAIDLKAWRVVDQWSGLSTDNLCRQITVNPRRPKAYIPHIRSRVTVAQGDGSIFPYVSVLDTKAGEGRRRNRIPMDAFLNNRVTANPWEVAVSSDGRHAFVVFSGTNDMFACKVVDDDYEELAYRSLLRTGNNPRAVRFSPDGKTVYVYNALDFNVVAYSVANLRITAKIKVCDNPLSPRVHKGKILFYSALQPMVGRRWISCSSCHPDGQPDGRTWQNPEGLRNTQSFAGLAWTHPVHWSADRDEVQDFEHTIRGPLMQGRGLIRGRVEASLKAPNKGKSETLDALAAYTNSHKFTLSPHAKKGLSKDAASGRAIFLSKKTGCAKCHSGAYFTDSQPRDVAQLLRHDVGTGTQDPSEKMGPKYDTPTLLGLYRTAPYLHDGRAETLEELLTKYNPGDRHGATSHLNPSQIRQLAEFLRALPYEDPQPAAKKQGLLKVE